TPLSASWGGGAGLGAPSGPGSDAYKGWLFKWTNYLKGYQRRWFVLSHGLLSYYRTQAEMAHTCRGTINLSTAHIDSEDACNIVLSNGGRTYHLKASSEVERQRWVTALELAKAKAIRLRSDQSGRVHGMDCLESPDFVYVGSMFLFPPIKSWEMKPKSDIDCRLNPAPLGNGTHLGRGAP
uniref:PH domain-containing protein n=1 Tax=Pelusios castaneus TaxID=367368 RepID=A0A8C8RES3_9SAUR